MTRAKKGDHDAQTSFRLSTTLLMRVRTLAVADGTSDGSILRRAVAIGLDVLEGHAVAPDDSAEQGRLARRLAACETSVRELRRTVDVMILRLRGDP